MLPQPSPTVKLPEEAAYFAVPGAHLYTVLHRAKNPVARVLLVGAFASERHVSIHPWVRWARYLAARGIEVLRYDYRGVGESTGVFEEMSFEDWSEDVQLLAEWAASQMPKLPLLLHGLELGAVLAGNIFCRSHGDALLLWSPPASANQVLRSTLQRFAVLEQLYEPLKNRKTVSDYIRLLEQGSSIEVQGYPWSSRLWMASFCFHLPEEINDEEAYLDATKKSVKKMSFGDNTTILSLPYPRYPEIKDLSSLYSASFDWIKKVCT